LGYLGKALFQIYRAYTGKYKNKIKEQHLSDNSRKLLVVSGIAGYTARGIVIGIIAYLIFRAAWTSNSDEAGGTGEAFQFLQNEFGAIVLAIIAFGLVMYGIFSFINAKHRQLNVD
jgi:ABC-type Na+ efflux pump permease subunit